MLRRHRERREDTTIVQKKKDANHRKFIHILFHVVKTSISALLSNYNDVCLSDVDIDTENKKKWQWYQFSIGFPEPKIINCEFAWIVRDFKKISMTWKLKRKEKVPYLYKFALLNLKVFYFLNLILEWYVSSCYHMPTIV